MAGALAHEAKDLEGPLVMASGITLAHRLPFTPVQSRHLVYKKKLFQVNLQLLSFFPLSFFLYIPLSNGYLCSFFLALFLFSPSEWNPSVITRRKKIPML